MKRAMRLLVLFSLGALLFNLPVESSQLLSGHRPAAAQKSQVSSRMPETAQMSLAIGLPLRHREALTNLLQDLYDPASASYRKFLTADQFAEQFGPTPADYEAVAAFFQGQGFTVRARHPNRMLLDVVGTVAQVERTFQLEMRMYQHPDEARQFHAPDRDPSVDLKVPLLHISGLDDFVVPRPASLYPRTEPGGGGGGGGGVPQGGSGPLGSYLGKDFRAAYAPSVALTGAGQYVGLLQFDGYYTSDISAYVTAAGLTNVPLINVLLNDFSGTPGTNNIEVALDIEMSIAMAPGLSGILVYEGRYGNDILNRMATDNLAKQLSASWTFTTDDTTTQIFQQFQAQGQSYFNASGDRGAYTAAPSSPTDNPYITSVGGTTLSTRGPGQGWLSEAAWNWASTGSGSGATGGGISTRFALPTWQADISMTTNHGSTTMRNLPDVAMVADNVYVIADNGKTSYVGGTSVASPLWAAFTALVNQQAAYNGLSSVGFLNPALYAIGKSTNYAATFHDTKTGNNTNSSSPTLYYACAGYDLCTGWGTPAGLSLINALAPPINAPVIIGAGASLVLETSAPTNGAIDPGEAVIASFTLQNVGGVRTTNLVATLLNTNGVSVYSGPQTYGALTGGVAGVSRQFTFVASGSCGGTCNPLLELRDGSTNLGTVSFSFPLGVPQITFSQNFDSVSPPAFPTGWKAQQTGGVTNWVTSTLSRDSTPNSAYAYEPTNAGVAELVSPAITITNTNAQLVFRNNYNTEVDPTNSIAYDGGVLEIMIGTGSWTDILAAGGSFASGGYTRTVNTTENPLNGRSVWGGASGGFITTAANLPAAAAGNNVRFKWRFGVDYGNYYGGSGWYVDSVTVRDGFACAAPNTNADVTVTQTVQPSEPLVGQTVAYILRATNSGTGPALGVTLSDTPPPNASFSWASPGYTNANGSITWNAGLLAAGRYTNYTLLLTATGGGPATNTVLVSSAGFDLDPANNLSTLIVQFGEPPAIVVPPTNQVALAGADVSFWVGATGTTPLGYQWQKEGVDLPGETGQVLTLTNVQPASGGNYTVTVTNLAGSQVSSNAVLRVLVPPAIELAGVLVTATNISFPVTTVNGLTYQLEYKDALDDSPWSPLAAPIAGTGATVLLQDTNAPALPSRFYRINCY